MVKHSNKKDVLLDEVNQILKDLETRMDQDFMRAGKTLAELFRTVCTAAAKLPNLELHTELMCVVNSDEELMVIFHRDAAEEGMDNLSDDEEGYPKNKSNNAPQDTDEDGGDDYNNDSDDYDDEEEGLLYDGD